MRQIDTTFKTLYALGIQEWTKYNLWKTAFKTFEKI